MKLSSNDLYYNLDASSNSPGNDEFVNDTHLNSLDNVVLLDLPTSLNKTNILQLSIL